MGVISCEQLFPASIFRPDESSQIGVLEISPPTATCIGFNRQSGRIVFEGETSIEFRLKERAWRYRYPGKEGDIHISNRWRLEIVAAPERSLLSAGHSLVVTQKPYSLNWVQSTKFKMYSKKSEAERPDAIVPALTEKEHPVAWLERNLKNLKHDPWETSAQYVAGISFPNGCQDEAQNTTGEFVFGACPDFDHLVSEMFRDPDIKKMLALTTTNDITFWYTQGEIKEPPHLYPAVIDEAETLMGLAIQQALAGPGIHPGNVDSEDWTGQPVSSWVRRIYCGHLNNRNKRESLLQKYEGSTLEDHVPSEKHTAGRDGE
jgi:hypothetical protein